MNYDFSDFIKELYRVSKNIEFKVFDIQLATDEHHKLYNSKKEMNKISYLVTFMCKSKQKMFLYKVIYKKNNPIEMDNLKTVIKKLEVGARTKYEIYKKTTNPFLALQKIEI